MPAMRRLIALILMFIVPLQYAWSATVAMHGHPAGDAVVVGAHAHDHDFHDAGHADHDLSVAADQDSHNDDSHHGSHCHHVLSLALLNVGPVLGHAEPGSEIGEPILAFHSRIPPLLDRPPLARA